MGKIIKTAIFLMVLWPLQSVAQNATANGDGQTRNWDMSTGFGVAVRDVRIEDVITLNAWCMVSTGRTSNTAQKIVDGVPGMPAWFSGAMGRVSTREGNVLCFGRARPKNTDYEQKLSFSAAWWVDGEQLDSDVHACRRDRSQCVHRWGDRMGDHQTSDEVNGLSVCIEVIADEGNGETLQSVTLSAGSELPEDITAAAGVFSEESCAARSAEWKSS